MKNNTENSIVYNKLQRQKYYQENKEKIKKKSNARYKIVKDILKEKRKIKRENDRIENPDKYKIPTKEEIKKKRNDYKVNWARIKRETMSEEEKQIKLLKKETMSEEQKQIKRGYANKHYKKNKDIIRSHSKLRRNNRTEEQKQIIKEKNKLYRIKNKDIIREKKKLKKKNNPLFKMAACLRNRMYHAIIKGSGFKIGLSQELLGCDWQTVKEWLESQFVDGMSWDNHGVDGWHIDHKIPCSFFDMTNEYEQKQCFHYTNLQPLWAKDNIIKADKIDFSDLFE